MFPSVNLIILPISQYPLFLLVSSSFIFYIHIRCLLYAKYFDLLFLYVRARPQLSYTSFHTQRYEQTDESASI